MGNIKNSVTILIVVHKQELWTLKRPSLVLRYFEKSDATPGTSFKAKTMKGLIIGGACLLVSEDLHFAFCRLLLGGSWLPPLHAPESSLVCSLRRLIIGRGYLNECNKDRKDSKQVSLHCGDAGAAVSSNKT